MELAPPPTQSGTRATDLVSSSPSSLGSAASPFRDRDSMGGESDTSGRRLYDSPSSSIVTNATPRTVARATNTRRFIEGILLLLAVNVIWVGASVLVQYIYNDLGFSEPFFITYVSNSLFVVYLGAVPAYRYVARCIAGDRSGFHVGTAYTRHGDGEDSSVASPSQTEPFTLKQTALVGLYICPVWFLAQCTYNASLDWTSVSSSTILSTVSGLFTFVLCIVFLKEKFHYWKLVGVAATIAGAVFVGLSDKEDPTNGSDTFGGDAIALFSAFCYAAYTTMIRRFIPNEHCVSMPLFFGFLGLFNSILLLPLLIGLNVFGVESLSSLTWEIFGFICLKGLVDNVLSDLLWARAVLLTSPTIATIGLTLTIPLAMVSDFVFKGESPTALLFAGSVCVSFGFVAVNLGGQYQGEESPLPSASGGEGRGTVGGSFVEAAPTASQRYRDDAQRDAVPNTRV